LMIFPKPFLFQKRYRPSGTSFFRSPGKDRFSPKPFLFGKRNDNALRGGTFSPCREKVPKKGPQRGISISPFGNPLKRHKGASAPLDPPAGDCASHRSAGRRNRSRGNPTTERHSGRGQRARRGDLKRGRLVKSPLLAPPFCLLFPGERKKEAPGGRSLPRPGEKVPFRGTSPSESVLFFQKETVSEKIGLF